MATQVTIRVGTNAVINRVVSDVATCRELEQFKWVDVDDISRDLILHGKYDMSVGDTRITVMFI